MVYVYTPDLRKDGSIGDVQHIGCPSPWHGSWLIHTENTTTGNAQCTGCLKTWTRKEYENAEKY